MRNEARSTEAEIDLEHRARQWDQERQHNGDDAKPLPDWHADWARSSFANNKRRAEG